MTNFYVAKYKSHPHLVSLKKTFLKVKCHWINTSKSLGWGDGWVDKTQGIQEWRLESGSPEPTWSSVQCQPWTSVIPVCTYDQVGTWESLEAHVLAPLAYAEVNNKRACHKQMEDKDWYLRLSSDVHMHTVACGAPQHANKDVHTHTQCTHSYTLQNKFLT